MHKRSVLRVTLALSLILAVVFTFVAPVTWASGEVVQFELNAPYPSLSSDKSGIASISAAGFSMIDTPGQYPLPHRLVEVLLPPDADMSSLSLDVTRGPSSDLGRRLFTPIPEDITTTGASSGVAGAASPPLVRIAAMGQYREFRFARVDFAPYTYDPVTGSLSFAGSAGVSLSFKRSSSLAGTQASTSASIDLSILPNLINADSAGGWYPSAKDSASATYNYVIITTNQIVANSTVLDDFIAHKQGRGFQVLTVTETDYNGLSGQPPNGRAEKIRQWLIAHYQSYSIEYVLLIGDPTPDGTGATAVPMKMTWPRRGAGTDEESPTDYFYADLTGNWDANHNEYYGEFTGDYRDGSGNPIPGGVDFTPEVYVGRIPFYGSYTDLDSILTKTINYENQTDQVYRKTILLPMSFSEVGYDGAPLAEQMWDDYLRTSGLTRYRMYQKGSSPCTSPPDSIYATDQELRGNPPAVRLRWAANPYGMVVWWGHGSPTVAAVGYGGCWDGNLMDTGQVGYLSNTQPAFVFENSCTNGSPETTDNLQYSLLRQGGIATFGASRVSWFNTSVGYGQFNGSTTNSGIAYEVSKRVAQVKTASKSLYQGKASMTPEYATRMMNFEDFNLYGDPSVKLFYSSTPVPAVSTGGLIIFSILVMTVAFFAIRRRRQA